MAGNFKVHAFSVCHLNDVTEDLDEVLTQIQADALEDRIKTIGQVQVRIEHIQQDNDGNWKLDFVKFRDVHGPGKAARDTPITGFEFDEGEVFCEETAAIYFPATGYILVQYNHHGVRAAAIEEYLSIYTADPDNQYTLRPKYDDDADRRFDNRVATKKITLAIDPRLLNQGDRDANTGLSQAIDLGNRSNASKVEITISAGRGRDRGLNRFVDRTITAARRLVNDNPDSVSRLEVGVVDNLDSKMQVLDLIAHRLMRNFTDINVGDDKRWPRDSRYQAIARAARGWRRVLV
ncbi:DUF6731 family protein [Aeromonas jandaei]|uniref:DUF6731 family protein n=1 Tax=Aeromonas jandaei TaxID=650 RepID=UPI003EC684C6